MAHQQHPSAFQTYRRELDHALLKPEQERALGLRTRDGDPAAQDALVTSHLAYSVHVAKRFLGRGLELDELVAIANLGMIQAAKRFDPDKGGFRTCARPWVTGLIRREIAKWRAHVTMPVQMATASLALEKRAEEIERALGRAPTHDELAAGLNVSSNLLRRALACRGEPIPIRPRDPEAEDAGKTRLAMLRMRWKDFWGERGRILEQAVDSLPHREATLLRHYFGFGRFQDASLERRSPPLWGLRESGCGSCSRRR